jgi:hypothetical protein
MVWCWRVRVPALPGDFGRPLDRVEHLTRGSSNCDGIVIVVSPPSLREFLGTLTATWFTGMSGSLSVPLAVAAIYVESATAKTLLGITAFVCFWAASYTIWSRERTERNKSERKAQEAEAKIKGHLKFVRPIRREPDGGHYVAYATLRNTRSAHKMNGCRCEIFELRNIYDEVVETNRALTTREQRRVGEAVEQFDLYQSAEAEIPLFEIDYSNHILYLLAATEKITLPYVNYTARVRCYGDTGESDEITVQVDTKSDEFCKLA